MTKRKCPAVKEKKEEKGNVGMQSTEMDDETCKSFGKGTGCMYWKNGECTYEINKN